MPLTSTTTSTKMKPSSKKAEELRLSAATDTMISKEFSCELGGEGEETGIIPHELIIRSLRRRLWKALYEEDMDTAFRAYTATTVDFKQWLTQEKRQEKMVNDQRKDKRDGQRSQALKKFGSFVKHGKMQSKRRSLPSNITNNNHDALHASKARSFKIDNTDTTTNATPTTMSNGNNNTAPEVQFPLLQIEMNPSEPFNTDDYKNPHDAYDEPLTRGAAAAAKQSSYKRNGIKKRKCYKQPRMTTSFFKSIAGAAASALRDTGGGDGGSTECDNAQLTSSGEMDATENDHFIDERMTTPFHEASRCGNGPLVQMMLKNNCIDPNVKNGQLRTALHMIAGGNTRYEDKHRQEMNGSTDQNHESKNVNTNEYEKHIGIGPPHAVSLSVQQAEEGAASAGSAKKAAKAVGRFFNRHFSQTKLDVEPDTNNEDTDEEEKSQCCTKSNWDKLNADRLDALLALLSYVHPDDGSPNAGEGASINAVDALGRTALHYAAELGREDICMALLSSFGIILTVVDDSARTPCELAAEQNHHELAAQLEARALLYSDPYGMDDELMASVLAEGYEEERKTSLVAPYAWFETLESPAKDRQMRLSKAFEQMEKIVKQREEEQEMQKFMYSQKDDDDDDDNKGGDGAKALKKLLEDDTLSPLSANVIPSGDQSSSSENEGQIVDGDEHDKAVGDYSGLVESEKQKERTDWNEFVSQLINNEGKFAGKSKKKEKDYSDDVRFLNLDIFNFLTEAHVEQYLAHHNWMVEKALEEFKVNPVRAVKDAQVDLHVSNFENAKDEIGVKKERLCSICFDEFDDDDDDEWKDLQNCEHGFCTSCLGDYMVECEQTRSTGLLIHCPHHECKALLSQFEIMELCPQKEVFDSLKNMAYEKFISSAYDLKFCPHPNCKGVVKLHVPEFVKQAKVDVDLLGLVGAVCTAVHSNSDDFQDNNMKDSTNDDTIQDNNKSDKEEEEEEKKSQTQEQVMTYDGVIDPEYMNSKCERQPSRAHRFCFVCGEPSYHWPVPCEQLAEWKRKMREEVGDIEQVVEGDGADTNDNNHKYNEIAQHLWMKANTRPCPKCKAPIEKNEGCNHVTCTNPHCKHEFCWICRKDWKLHNTATGGFFRCNRWQEEDNHEYYDSANPTEAIPADIANNEEAMNDPEVMMRTYGTSMHEARVAWKRSKEMKRFLHHYTRWNAHSESAALEERMSQTVCSRLAPVVKATIDFTGDQDFNFGGKGLSFVHSAFIELLECRSILQHSYAFSFYRYETLSSKQYRRLYQLVNEQKAFEQMQSELEILTEQMSDIVARAHLRATQTQIVFLTHAAAEKRNEFSNIMISVLNEVRKEEKSEAAAQSSGSDWYRSSNSARLTTRHHHRSPRATMPTAVDDIRTIMMEHVSRQHREDAEAEGRIARGRGRRGGSEGNDIVEALRASLDAGVELSYSRQQRHNNRTNGSRNNREHQGDEAIVEALRASLGEFMASTDDDDDDDDVDENNDENANGGVGIVSDEDDDDITPRARLVDDDDGNDDFMGAFGRDFDDEDDMPPGLSDWACRACTYMNHGGHICAMCGTFRR